MDLTSHMARICERWLVRSHMAACIRTRNRSNQAPEAAARESSPVGGSVMQWSCSLSGRVCEVRACISICRPGRQARGAHCAPARVKRAARAVGKASALLVAARHADICELHREQRVLEPNPDGGGVAGHHLGGRALLRWRGLEERALGL